MAFDTTIDNEGIKKGLGLVVSELIQSNKKLGDLNEPNMLKAFKENQAEIFASYAQHRKEMSVAKEELDYQKKVTKGLKNFSVSKAGVQIDETGKERRPNVDDTLFGQMAKLVDVLKVYTEKDTKIQTEKKKSSSMEALTTKAKREEEAKQKKADLKEKAAERMVNRSFFKSFLKTAHKTNVEARERSNYLRLLPKKLLAGTLFATGMQTSQFLDSNKTLSANLGTKLGNLRNYFFKSDKENDGKEEGRFKKLGKGLLSITKTIRDTFMKYLGNPFMLLIKGIGLALLTAGVFKFFASPTWQKMKPNIAQSIGDGLAVMDKALDKLIEAIPLVTDGLKLLASGLMTAFEFIAEMTGFKGENLRVGIEEQVRIDLRGHDESVIQAEVDKRVREIRRAFIQDEGKKHDDAIKAGTVSVEKADALFAEKLREFDADTYGAYISGDKIMLNDADLKRHQDMIEKQQSNFMMSNQNNQVSNQSYTRYIQNMTNKNAHSSGSSDQK